MSSVLRKLVTANFVLLGILFLAKPLQELADLPETSLVVLLRTVARYLSAVVTLVSSPARVWLWVASPLLLLLLLVQGFGKLSAPSDKEDNPRAKGGDNFWLNTLLVAIWLAAFGLSVWSGWI